MNPSHPSKCPRHCIFSSSYLSQRITHILNPRLLVEAHPRRYFQFSRLVKLSNLFVQSRLLVPLRSIHTQHLMHHMQSTSLPCHVTRFLRYWIFIAWHLRIRSLLQR